VVFVREVLVRVRHRRTLMAMGLPNRLSIAQRVVVMVHVVFVLMFMFHRFVPVRMLVPLAQVQPDPQRHQRTSDQQPRRHGFPEQADSQDGAEEWRH